METMMSGGHRRRRSLVGSATCLICAAWQPHLGGVDGLSLFQHVVRGSSQRHIPAAPTANACSNAVAAVATAATLAVGVMASPLPSNAADGPSADVAASVLRRQLIQRVAPTNPKLSDTDAFRNLQREPPTTTTRALRELAELQELQDARLEACAERGSLWEQCFMFGDSALSSSSSSDGGSSSGGTKARKGATNLQNGLDYQYLSPVGALESGESGNAKLLLQQEASQPKKATIPTW